MRVVFFEDDAAGELGPLSLMRPVFELVCGRWSLRDRLLRFCDLSDWGALVRGYLAETCREDHPAAHFNDLDWLKSQPALLVNGRWLPTFGELTRLPEIAPDEVGIADGTVAYLTLDPLEAEVLLNPSSPEPEVVVGPTGSETDRMLSAIAQTRRRVSVEGPVIRRPWDLVEQNAEQLAADFRSGLTGLANRAGKTSSRGTFVGLNVAVLGKPEDVEIDPQAVVGPFVVLDARSGPISIESGARIGSFTQIEGPCHVGSGSRLIRATIRGGTTIGSECRVGGEVESSILHGYVNKYHDGFVGHSYLCPWVNLGAQTATSDLKNDYSPVRVPLAGEPIDTGLTKVGCFIGDHTKTGMGSLFNTGTSVGVMCQILPGGELLPKHIPSFSRIWHGELIDGWELPRDLESAEKAMARRNCTLTQTKRRLLQHVSRATWTERRRAIERFSEQKRHTQVGQAARR